MTEPPPAATADEHLLHSARDADFKHTDPWRVLRIMGDFVHGFDALAELGPAVTIFGSARTRPGDPDYRAACETARLLAEAGFSIITGGGPGIMEAANRGARLAGVCSVGLNIELPFEQATNAYVDTNVDFRYFMVRKTMLVKYAQAFVIFPGGFGTTDELFEALTLIQTGKIQNFPVILFGSEYWAGLLDWLRSTVVQEARCRPASWGCCTGGFATGGGADRLRVHRRRLRARPSPTARGPSLGVAQRRLRRRFAPPS